MNREHKIWLSRYKESLKLLSSNVTALTGFNANIDSIHDADDLEIDFQDSSPELVNPVRSLDDLRSCLNYCVENSENHEVDMETRLEISGEERIGGQAGIIANYLSSIGKNAVFYTPIFSDELAKNLDSDVLFPVSENGLRLLNLEEAVNSDKYKKNHIFEFQTDQKSGRLILSDSLEGFYPYFQGDLVREIEELDTRIDCGLFSGFQGLQDRKIFKKARKQLSKFESPLHLEYVHKGDEICKLIIEEIVPAFDSLGMDEEELKCISGALGIKEHEGDLNLGEAFNISKAIIRMTDLQRIHLHTFRYNIVVADEDYSVESREIRKSMLFGELSAAKCCFEGEIAGSNQIKNFKMEKKRLQDLKELRDFAKFFELDDFVETGTANIDGFKVVAIPTIVVEDPERTVGMGDIISAGAFASEHSNSSFSGRLRYKLSNLGFNFF